MASGSTVKPVDRGDISSLIKTVTYQKSYTLEPGKSLGITASQFNVSTPTGYTVAGVVEFNAGSGQCAVNRIDATATGTGQMMALKNTTASTTMNNTATITILYVRSGYVAT